MAHKLDKKGNDWNQMALKNETNLRNLQSEAEEKANQTQSELLEKAASLNSETNSSDWWTPFVTSAVSGLTVSLAR